MAEQRWRAYQGAEGRASTVPPGCRRLPRLPAAVLPAPPDETKALARQCLDQALLLAGIADRSPGGIQARRQRCIGHTAPIPNGVDEVVFADDALPVTDQIVEQVEHLWRDRDGVRSAMQLAPVNVECVLLEEIAQAANPLGGWRAERHFRPAWNAKNKPSVRKM